MNLTLRTITCGFNWENENRIDVEDKIYKFFNHACAVFKKEKINVRTNRLNLPSFNTSTTFEGKDIGSVVNWLSTFCIKRDIRWLCVPFSTLKQDMKEVNNIAIEVVKRYKNVFINYILTENGNINRDGIIYASKLIKSVSRLSNSGYDNFRVGASFNCPPNAPFFPFTYHKGKDGFSISLELIPLMKNIIERHKSEDIEFIRDKIIQELHPELTVLNDICLDIERQTNIKYYGADISLAPYPENDNNSVAALIESLGMDGFGSAGTVFFTAYLTNILKRLIVESGIKSIGFNGVMFSLLEDTRLGINSSTKEFSLDSLICYSTVCGCGIDMVPIPGDVFEEEIGSLMLDIASISCLLEKPLGVRMLPIPMKRENEFTEFGHDFLHNTRIKSVKNRTCFTKIFDSEIPFTFLKS